MRGGSISKMFQVVKSDKQRAELIGGAVGLRGVWDEVDSDGDYGAFQSSPSNFAGLVFDIVAISCALKPFARIAVRNSA